MGKTMDSCRFPEAQMTDDHESHQNTIIIIDRDLYKAAKIGDASVFKESHKEHLDHLLTQDKSTILHIHINNRSDHVEMLDMDPLYTYQLLNRLFRKVNAAQKLKKKPISSTFVEEIVRMCPPLLKMSNARGDTPLHIAARHRDTPAVEALINNAKSLELDPENGVQGLRTEMLRTKNKKGDTALHVAVRLKHLHVAEILSEEDKEILCYRNEAGQTPLHLAIKGRHRHFVLQMLDKHRELLIPARGDSSGRTLLHEAVISKDEGIIRAILSKRKDLCQQKDERGWVPLHHAAKLGNVSIVKALLECDPQAACIKDKNGRLPFQVAAALKYHLIINEIISWCPNCYELVVNDISEGRREHFRTLILKYCIMLIEYINICPLRGHENNDVERFNQETQCALSIWRKTFMEPAVATPSLASEVDKAKEFTLVVAALIATVTFAAGFTLPGGYVSDKGPQQGSAVLMKKPSFKTFVIVDTIAMVLSTSSVLIHLFLALKQDTKKDSSYFNLAFILIIYAMIAMLIAFMTGMYAVLGVSNGLGIAICLIVSCCFILPFDEMMGHYMQHPRI